MDIGEVTVLQHQRFGNFRCWFAMRELTLSRALMTSTSTRKGGAAETIWQTYCTAAAPLTAPKEMSAARPDPAGKPELRDMNIHTV